MVTYEDLTAACLRHGVMPAVVPQLKTITLGGALAGVGIESSSSHRYGLVHDTVLELDVLLGDGRVVTCTPRERARGSLLRLPELVRHARLCAAVEGEDGPGEAVRARSSTSTTSTGEGFFGELDGGLPPRRRRFRRRGRVRAGQMFVTVGRFVDRAPYVERLHLRSHLLSLHPGAPRGLPHGPRLSLALGHRLVLVLEERVGAEPPRAAGSALAASG